MIDNTSFGLSAAVFLITSLAIGATPASAEGQVPGQRIPSRERIRSEFLENVMRGIHPLRREWMADVQEDRLDHLVSLYSSDAVIIPPDGMPRRGEEAIREFWSETLPNTGSIETGLSDVDASGQMAMVAGNYLLHDLDDDGRSRQISGGMLTVFVQTGRTWHIRAQVFGNPGSL